MQLVTSPNLLQDGDAVEKATWPDLQSYFPHYEEFWRTNIVPLRATGSIHPRCGIDEDFEFLAMQHYSLYVNLGKAYKRILGTDAESLINFPDDVYAMLHRAAELATKVVKRFETIFHQCAGQKAQINTSRIVSFMKRTDIYRNLIHQEFPAVQVDAAGRPQIPRAEELEKYSKWTDVLYRSRVEDFVDVGTQLVDDFRSLCSALETTWKRLCELSSQLSENKRYLKRRAQGDSVHAPTLSLNSPPVSGFMISTGISVSSTAASVIMTRKPGK